jgi:hypothetical protein
LKLAYFFCFIIKMGASASRQQEQIARQQEKIARQQKEIVRLHRENKATLDEQIISACENIVVLSYLCGEVGQCTRGKGTYTHKVQSPGETPEELKAQINNLDRYLWTVGGCRTELIKRLKNYFNSQTQE